MNDDNSFNKTILSVLIFMSVLLLAILVDAAKPRYVWIEKECDDCKKKREQSTTTSRRKAVKK